MRVAEDSRMLNSASFVETSSWLNDRELMSSPVHREPAEPGGAPFHWWMYKQILQTCLSFAWMAKPKRRMRGVGMTEDIPG